MPLMLNDNAGWCWFQGERAIVAEGKLFVGSVASGGERDGNIELTQLELSTGKIARSVLHANLEADDHNAPALHVRRDGRILAMYTRHGSDTFKRQRVSTRPFDVREMAPETTYDLGVPVCYSNLHSAAGRLYDCYRGEGWNPCVRASDDDGLTWQPGRRLLHWSRPDRCDPKFTGLDGGRPYPIYASDGRDAIHLITSEDHPRAYDNSIYHGIFRGEGVLNSRGERVAPTPPALTRVYAGDADHVAWPCDLRVGLDGHPRAIFSLRVGDAAVRQNFAAGGADLRYMFARFDGDRWHVHPLCHAGHRLYAAENDYTGLATLDPHRSGVVYVSTSCNPLTGQPLISHTDGHRHYELFRGITPDQGLTWRFTPLTRDSSVDHLRSLIPQGDFEQTVVLWLQGKIHSYTVYDLQLMLMQD